MAVVQREVAAVVPAARREESAALTRSLLATVRGRCSFTIKGTFRILGEDDSLAAARARVAAAKARYDDPA
ncbi:hypothetical protein OMW55_02570 [Sphingomonas sp. BN140010]|uniref:Uncharacterized protein n=1 Tax=Sphingomonas arvum TaxID=2992113 RepID=A0ABT3JD18_9SPHN|nr:hypothetical protein [Sphingomonas sp. BN140010]MCW3796691.1 hypothetical protein [Sphingomonas sp. BN140010]